jgi:hypothetical protein
MPDLPTNLRTTYIPQHLTRFGSARFDSAWFDSTTYISRPTTSNAHGISDPMRIALSHHAMGILKQEGRKNERKNERQICVKVVWYAQLRLDGDSQRLEA